MKRIREKLRLDWLILTGRLYHNSNPDSFTLSNWWACVKWFAGVMTVLWLLDPHANHDGFGNLLGGGIGLLLMMLFGVE